jgi:hypothetical protein
VKGLTPKKLTRIEEAPRTAGRDLLPMRTEPTPATGEERGIFERVKDISGSRGP